MSKSVFTSDIYRPFMSLLRAGLWDIKPDFSFFPLSHSQWNHLFKVSQRQTLSAIIYDGVLNLPEEYHPPLELLMRWTAEVDLVERRNMAMDKLLASELEFYSSRGIPVILLKGQCFASLYIRPGHRTCGDIDLYTDLPESAKKKLNDKGIHVTKQTRDTLIYKKKEFFIELHNKVFDIHNPFSRRDIKNLMSNPLLFADRLHISGKEVSVPSPLANHVLASAHILKHMLSFGISLRQLCDVARLCHVMHDRIDGEELCYIYKSLGMYRWVMYMHFTLVKEIGLKSEYLPFPLKGDIRTDDWLLEDIWMCGNFGFFDDRYRVTASPSKRRSGVFQQWIRRFFHHAPLVPGEAFWFPLVHLLSRK